MLCLVEFFRPKQLCLMSPLIFDTNIRLRWKDAPNMKCFNNSKPHHSKVFNIKISDLFQIFKTKIQQEGVRSANRSAWPFFVFFRVLCKNKVSLKTADHAQTFKKYRDSFHWVQLHSLLPNISNALNKTNTVPKSQKLC